jgi:hypothetical protein
MTTGRGWWLCSKTRAGAPDTDPVNAWLYFDGPLSALRDQSLIVLDVPGGGFVALLEPGIESFAAVAVSPMTTGRGWWLCSKTRAGARGSLFTPIQ